MILVFGSLNVDVMIAVDRLPQPGETVLGPGYALTAGGKGANQALAASRAGAWVALVGSIGTDPLAETAIADLRDAGVDLTHLGRVVEPTGLAAICVDQAGENQIAVASGANRRTAVRQVTDDLLEPGTLVVLQMEVPVGENWELVRRAKARGARVLLNAAPAGAIPPDSLAALDWLIVNETEAKQVAGHLGFDVPDSSLEAARKLARETGTTIIVTLGAAGAVACQPDGSGLAVPALAIKPVDTVGAGDSFVGGFAAALDRGLTLGEALRYASVGGALACLRTGAQPSLPTRAEIEARLPELPAVKAI